MIELVHVGGIAFYPEYKIDDSLKFTLEIVKKGINVLKTIKKDQVLALYDAYSKKLISDKRTNSIEGVAFLSNWLRKANFKKIVDKNIGNLSYLESFIGEKKRIKAQPRGIACHWIAGNVPTLGMFSLFQSMFVGNANILRIPPQSHDTMVRLLDVFSSVKIDSGVSGKDLLESVAIIYYDKADTKANQELSKHADVRIVWGGESAVKAITGLPRRPHCEDIIFGPKYSFSVFDKDAIESSQFSRKLRFLVSDIYLFDQAACTSPHVVFFEKGGRKFEEIIEMLVAELERASSRYKKVAIDQYIMTKIINARAEYALDLEKTVICPEENDWTILINKKMQLEEPIESRTIFVKEADSIMDVVPLITRKIQTIGCAIDDKKKLVKFADETTFRGVSRCVNVGQMHLFDSPWDGMLFMSRLVNWVTLYHG
ncbi:MAG: acyl-CoA reductase [Promethearchaeota archaeon]